MNCLSVFTLFAALLIAFVSASAEFKFTKKRITASKYERRCEDDESNLSALNVDEDNIAKVAKFMRKYHIHEAWVGSVNNVNFEGATLLKVHFNRDGKYDFHTFEVIPKGHAMKYSADFFALCARN